MKLIRLIYQRDNGECLDIPAEEIVPLFNSLSQFLNVSTEELEAKVLVTDPERGVAMPSNWPPAEKFQETPEMIPLRYGSYS